MDNLWGHEHYDKDKSRLTFRSKYLVEGKETQITLMLNLTEPKMYAETEIHRSILIRGEEADHQVNTHGVDSESSKRSERRQTALAIIKPPPNDEY